MEIQTNIDLNNFTTMRLGGPARFMATATSSEELLKLVERAQSQKLPYIVLGGGSNIIFGDQGFDGLVILNRINGFETTAEDTGSVTLRIGAGELWDSVVARSVEMRLSGIECMSGIPGTAGATPIQNVGAYGQEIADSLIELEALDTTTNQFVTLTNEACGFAYRNSNFKNPDTRHHIITSITLRLNRSGLQPPFYASLQSYLDAHDTKIYTPDVLRQAVLAIRADKLPDPSVYPNSGSFFRNPIIDTWQYEDLLKEYPDMPNYPMDDQRVKIPAGWLIDQAGLKNHAAHGCKTHDKNALVIINVSATSTKDLDEFKEDIRSTIRDTFRISLEQEPEEL